MTNPRPVVTADDAFVFTLQVNRTPKEEEKGRLPMDDGTVQRFMRWLLDNDIPQFRGGMSGPGIFHGTFPADQKFRIIRWCKNEGLLDEGATS